MCLRCGSLLTDGHPIVFPRNALPAWPCGWPKLEIDDRLARIVWTFATLQLTFDPDEARGIARRLLELADDMDSRLA